MSKDGSRLGRLGVLAPAALSVCVDASVLAAPAAGAILSTVLRELSKAFMLKKWFHGVMSAQDAEQLLMQKGKNGYYLVRESQNHPGEFVLSVRVRRKVSHVMIRRAHNKYDVGIGESFDDLTDLIEHCRTYPLTENSGDVIRLTQPVNSFRARTMRCQAPEEDMGKMLLNRYDEAAGNEAAGGSSSPERSSALDDAHWSRTKSNGFYGQYVGGDMVKEFRALKRVDQNSTFTTFASQKPDSQVRNRYKNVLPYDQTRVVLTRKIHDFHFNAYINASYIKPMKRFNPIELCGPEEGASGSNSFRAPQPSPSVDAAGVSHLSKSLGEKSSNTLDKPKTSKIHKESRPPGLVWNKFYIATQGCMWTTIEDFWEMVLENDIRVIAMLGRRVENGDRKCETYWPEHGKIARYGDFQVRMIREYAYEFHITREFELTFENKTTLIYQYQYKDWPDHGVPDDTESILEYLGEINRRMLQIANGSNPPKKNIMCVHCSAGVGRTGALIAIDMLIDQVKINGDATHIDIYSTVRLLRQQRAGMVQNIMQYKFIYLTMRDYLDAAAKFTRVTRPAQSQRALNEDDDDDTFDMDFD